MNVTGLTNLTASDSPVIRLIEKVPFTVCIRPLGAVGIYNEVIRYRRWFSWLIRF